MNENSHTESSLPVCEMRLQLLRCQLETHKQTVENKKTNLEALDKLTRALLRGMNSHGDDYLPRTSMDLYNEAKVAERVYERNFGSFYGVILCIKTQIVIDIDKMALGTFGTQNYEEALRRLFSFYAQAQEMEESAEHTRLRFALRWFADEFWETALHRLFPLVVNNNAEYRTITREMLFSRFTTSLRFVLFQWSGLNFDEKHIDDCVSLLGTLVGLEERRLEAIDSALIPFSQS